MKSTFKLVKLANKTFILVEGTDEKGEAQSTYVSAEEFYSLQKNSKVEDAIEAFNEKTKEFFKPLTDAKKALVEAQKPDIDEDFVITVQEAVEAVAGQDEVKRVLSEDTVILRLIEAGKTKRLRWVLGGITVLAK